jgi:hypothetical protein
LTQRRRCPWSRSRSEPAFRTVRPRSATTLNSFMLGEARAVSFGVRAHSGKGPPIKQLPWQPWPAAKSTRNIEYISTWDPTVNARVSEECVSGLGSGTVPSRGVDAKSQTSARECLSSLRAVERRDQCRRRRGPTARQGDYRIFEIVHSFCSGCWRGPELSRDHRAPLPGIEDATGRSRSRKRVKAQGSGRVVSA